MSKHFRPLAPTAQRRVSLSGSSLAVSRVRLRPSWANNRRHERLGCRWGSPNLREIRRTFVFGRPYWEHGTNESRLAASTAEKSPGSPAEEVSALHHTQVNNGPRSCQSGLPRGAMSKQTASGKSKIRTHTEKRWSGKPRHIQTSNRTRTELASKKATLA